MSQTLAHSASIEPPDDPACDRCQESAAYCECPEGYEEERNG